MTKQLASIQDLRPQTRNANKHTPRGLGALERSIQADGWIGAITVAADGETFDGSARIEVGAGAGFDDAIVIHSDGSRPIVHVREDIPTADDPRAKRLGVAANRIAQLDFDPDAQLLAELAGEVDLSPYYTTDELVALLAQVQVEPGGGGDDFDTTPADGPTRTQLGDLWQIGPHRLLVGDCTDAANVERLMGGGRAQAIVSDPPYGIKYHSNQPAWDGGVRRTHREFGNDELDTSALVLWYAVLADHAPIYIYTRWDVLPVWMQALEDAGAKVRQRLIWDKSHFTMGNLDYYGSQTEDIIFATKGEPRLHWEQRRGNLIKTSSITYAPEGRTEHATQKPLAAVEPYVADAVPRDGVVADPFLGSGTTLIAAHRTGRRCYGCEISPKYADVILRRAEAEGLTCERIDG